MPESLPLNDDFAAPAYAGVERELRVFIAAQGLSDLRLRGVVEQLNLRLAAPKKPMGYWQTPSVLLYR